AGIGAADAVAAGGTGRVVATCFDFPAQPASVTASAAVEMDMAAHFMALSPLFVGGIPPQIG
ncbi:MAG: hypothetical protein J0I25_13690, partial [Sphingomonadales bacterium]|nr:hypothetical protein [Sphingomonadales bacterium]